MVQVSTVARYGCWNAQPGGGEGARVVEVVVVGVVVGEGVGVTLVPLHAAEVVQTGQGLPSPGISQETCEATQFICGQDPVGWVGVDSVLKQFLII